ncbi:Non-lysosomal glucosylceramidase [Operophtera brumata]|uniref:Non-lysosomal glucosylceramidase n=1 Tax=Operophtera brumata TaxID=104452 RepID=A0A0L7KYV5_OPEBR|nr:Non-lysosomal glucosylceramidase [Operophtera brumata]
MNELYFVADGGTIWFDVPDEYPDSDPRFVVLQYMYRDCIGMETQKTRTSLYDGKSVKFKIKDSIPHDLGDPEDIPFFNINAYNIHDVSEWKDLSLKFILQVFRDYRVLRAHCAPFGGRCDSMQYIDDVRDGGESALAYCGGLWVAAVRAVLGMARALGHAADEQEFSALLERATHAYHEKLWNGSYYRFDTRPANEHVVMADQLAGHCLAAIYEHNVRGWCGGKMGAVNGYVTGARPHVDRSALQSEEMWTGVTYGLAATMIYEGTYVTGARPHGNCTALQSEEMWTGVTYGLAATMIYEAARRPHGAAERGDVDRRHVRACSHYDL